MTIEYLQVIKQLLWKMENTEMSYGDFQQNAELIKRGLDFMVQEKEVSK